MNVFVAFDGGFDKGHARIGFAALKGSSAPTVPAPEAGELDRVGGKTGSKSGQCVVKKTVKHKSKKAKA